MPPRLFQVLVVHVYAGSTVPFTVLPNREVAMKSPSVARHFGIASSLRGNEKIGDTHDMTSYNFTIKIIAVTL